MQRTRRLLLILSIVGGTVLLVIAGVVISLRWLEATAEQRAKETALSGCAAEVVQAGGVVGDLWIRWSAHAEGSAKFWIEGATVGGRPVRCVTDGFRRGGWVAGVTLSYLDGSLVK